MSFQATKYGKYVLIDRIAVGGMAEVFRAKTFGVHGFERLLVIKRILPHLTQDQDFIEMFIDEAKTAVTLTHANICQVTDLGKIDDVYFIAMEFINGKDLRAVLKKCHLLNLNIPIAFVLYIVLEALKGLSYAHQKTETLTGQALGIIHRDISPQNIMISYHGDVKIVDFGIAKSEHRLHKTQAGVLKGKFGYMSPEQAQGLGIDQRSDLFSMGIILFELLGSKRLFHSTNDHQTLEALKKCEIPAITKINPLVSKNLENAVFKALKADPNARYQSAEQFHMELSKIFYNEFADFRLSQFSTFLQDLFKTEIVDEHESLKRSVDMLDPRLTQNTLGSFDSKSTPSDLDQNTVVSIKHQRPKLFKKQYIYLFLMFISLLFFLKITGVDQRLYKPKEYSIQVESLPLGAKIFLDGQIKGVTPLTLKLKRDSKHELEFALEDYESAKDSFEVKSDARIHKMLTKLQPKFSSLKITSSPPGAKIYVNKQATKAITPFIIEELQFNQTYDIELSLDGYQSDAKAIQMQEQRHEINFELKKQMSMVTFNIQPKTSTVLINNQLATQNPIQLNFDESYSIEIQSLGYVSKKFSFIPKNLDEKLQVKLEKIQIPKGKINITAIPWANVYIDGKNIGSTPILEFELSVGQHNIVFEHEVYGKIEKNVKIQKDNNPPIIIDFKNR